MNEGGEGSERDPGRTKRASNRPGQRGMIGAGGEKVSRVRARAGEDIKDEENNRPEQDSWSIREGVLAMGRTERRIWMADGWWIFDAAA